jgi:hypothetical protein
MTDQEKLDLLKYAMDNMATLVRSHIKTKAQQEKK